MTVRGTTAKRVTRLTHQAVSKRSTTGRTDECRLTGRREGRISVEAEVITANQHRRSDVARNDRRVGPDDLHRDRGPIVRIQRDGAETKVRPVAQRKVRRTVTDQRFRHRRDGIANHREVTVFPETTTAQAIAQGHGGVVQGQRGARRHVVGRTDATVEHGVVRQRHAASTHRQNLRADIKFRARSSAVASED